MYKNELLEKKRLEDNVYFFDYHTSGNDDKQEVIHSLMQNQKFLNPKFFYDTVGSELFEQITQLPEYYPTRTERKILRDNAHEIAQYCGEECVLIEPGSGSSEKVRLLLDDLKPKAYIPMDIACEFLQSSAKKLYAEYNWLEIHAICADFAQLNTPPNGVPNGKHVIFYPGSTIGNMQPDDALKFLQKLKQWIDPAEGGGVLIGVDLHKSSDILNAAYNDQQGVTAHFNLNALDNINTLFNADFDLENFKHHAFYNESEKRIEMHLVSQKNHDVSICGESISFKENETIHTENSYKYTLDGFASLAEKAGFKIEKSWLDEEQLFSVHYLSANK